MKTYVGIDVSKDTLAVAFPLTPDAWKVGSFNNSSPNGSLTTRSSRDHRSDGVVLGATHLSTLPVCQASICISVINPKQSHHFSKMQLSVTKTDESDAVLLARYGQMAQPPVYEMDSEVMLCLRQKRTLLRQYEKQQRSLANLHHSFSPLPVKDDQVQVSLQ